jgi:hypothetical protein
MAFAFVGIAAMFMLDPQQINKPLLAALLGAFIVLWLGLAGWLVYRLLASQGQRVLLYPEGIVVWRDGEPRPYRWAQIRSVTSVHRATTHGALGRMAYGGRDLNTFSSLTTHR